MPTPSNDDPICKQFFNTMASKGIVLPGRKDSYSIEHWNNITVRNKKRCIEQNIVSSNKDTPIKQTQTFECHSISIQRTPEKTTCYFNEAGSGPGWCGTCYEGNLRPGQEGYCDYYHGTICNISYQVM